MQTPQTVVVTYIAASPEQVWQALTDPALSVQYFFGRRVESDWQVGSPFVLRMDDGKIDSQGVVLACEPPYRLSVTWRVEWLEAFRTLPEVVVTWQLDALGEAVRLTVSETHQEPVDEQILQGGRNGWPLILAGLKTLLETGRPLRVETPRPPPAPQSSGVGDR
ncbi:MULTISPECIES: SRPBCC family protein [unclassified Cupriavidus]|uniref:SRPBCC family protein n=1 Tax=Cupriavidus sp. H19C3 TaxID=3241603 RepID=UPI003BF7C236